MLNQLEFLSGNFTRDQMMSKIAHGYCEELIHRNAPIPTPEKIASAIVDNINKVCRVANTSREKGERWKPVEELDYTRIAICLAELNLVRRVQLNDDEDEKSYVLGIYEPKGPKRGLYNIDEDAINPLCRRYNGSLRKKDISEIKAVLMDTAPIVKRCFDPDLIPVNNGIFDYKKKQLIDFDPKYVFTSKCGTDYIPNAQSPIISNPDGTVWDVESWIESLVSNHPDKDEMADLLWKIIGATVRYLVPWNKAAFLISPKGNNGKGTLCELMRSLLGSGNYANIPIANFSKEYLLETLARVNGITSFPQNFPYLLAVNINREIKFYRL
jgi:putative DNA primase/helicase